MNRWLKTLLMLIPGCATGTVITYQHGPTAGIRKSFDLANPALSPYTVGEVALVPELASVSHNDREIVLYMLAARASSVTVQRWELRGTGAATALREGEPHQDVSVVKAADPAHVNKGVTGELVLGEVKNAELEALFKSGPCVLTVTVAPPGGADQTIQFRFERDEREVTGML